MKDKIHSKIIGVRNLTNSVFVLQLERNGFVFSAGQYLVLNIPGENKAREYSIYSSENDEFIELLIKEVSTGEFSKELRHLKIGTKVQISGPFGYFILPQKTIEDKHDIVFVATGTGISPFHSIILSNPNLNYTLVHGVRLTNEAYEPQHYPIGNYILCVSKEKGGNFHGRVTDYLKNKPINHNAIYFLCGNSNMVNEAMDYLEENGLPPQQIKTEVFF